MIQHYDAVEVLHGQEKLYFKFGSSPRLVTGGTILSCDAGQRQLQFTATRAITRGTNSA